VYLLGRLKDVMFWMSQVNGDRMDKTDGLFFNKARNELQLAIAAEEKREWEDLLSVMDTEGKSATEVVFGDIPYKK